MAHGCNMNPRGEAGRPFRNRSGGLRNSAGDSRTRTGLVAGLCFRASGNSATLHSATHFPCGKGSMNVRSLSCPGPYLAAANCDMS